MYDGGNSIYYIFTTNTNTIPNLTILLLILTLLLPPTAVKTRRAIEKVLPGLTDIDVDLELDETNEK